MASGKNKITLDFPGIKETVEKFEKVDLAVGPAVTEALQKSYDYVSTTEQEKQQNLYSKTKKSRWREPHILFTSALMYQTAALLRFFSCMAVRNTKLQGTQTKGNLSGITPGWTQTRFSTI